MNKIESLGVLMSVFYKEKPEYINHSLKSLYNQSYRADEILLVKEGDLTNKHIEVLNYWESKFGHGVIKIIDAGEAKGLAACLNVGLKASNCEYIARFDSDDECLPNRFEKQMSYFANNPDVVLLGGQIEEFDDDMEVSMGIRNVPTTYNKILSYSKWRSPFNHQTVIYKRDVAIKLGCYPVVPVNEDYTFWAKFLANKFKVANLPDILVKARTGKGLINRRSGIKYLKGEFIMIESLYESKLLNFYEYIWQYVSRTTLRLMPKKLLAIIYSQIRKK
ncbi:MAG: glycosyltransferase [Pedobacter sp.]|nr:MAG: glycosyltransferase [Pedobacter sp.]